MHRLDRVGSFIPSDPDSPHNGAPDAEGLGVRPSPFTQDLRTATRPAGYRHLLAAGIGRGALAGPHWLRPSRGQYRPRVAELTVTQRILDAAALLPAGGAIGGWAAAYVHGVLWLDGRDGWTGAEVPVLACVGAATHRLSLPGVRYTRARLPIDDVTVVAGVPVTTPLRTALDLTRRATTLEEAVVSLDALGAFRLLDRPAYLARLDDLGRQPGVRQARSAAALTDPAVRSPWESRLRMRYQLGAGLPRPEVNVPVFSLRGDLLGIPDLFDAEAGLVTEFDGAGHRARGQHHLDNHREERFEGHNLVVTRADSLDLRGVRAVLTGRLRQAYDRGRQRDRRRDRWTLEPPDWWLDQLDPELSDEDKEAMYGSP